MFTELGIENGSGEGLSKPTLADQGQKNLEVGLRQQVIERK